MLDSLAVRVGFVTQLLWSRYGDFWRELVESAGAEAVFADEEGLRAALSDPDIINVPTAAFKLAAAQARALADKVDLLLLPQLNPESDLARGGAQDPWIADFPQRLHTALHGLPNYRAVPITLDEQVESSAIELLQALMHDPAQVKRVWGRLRPAIKPAAGQPVSWSFMPGELTTVALLGQPWLLNDRLARAVTKPGEHVVSQHRLAAEELRREGLRLDGRVIGTDAEVLGAARLSARRGPVARLRLLVDAASGSDAWLAKRVESSVHKPVEVITVQDALGSADPVDILANWQLE